MAPKDSDAPANRDFELLVDAVKSMKSEIAVRAYPLNCVTESRCNTDTMQIDYDKLAERRGLKNAASARAGWHSLKNKYGLVSDGASSLRLAVVVGGEADLID